VLARRSGSGKISLIWALIEVGTFFRVEGSSRLTIDKNRVSWSGDTGMYEADKAGAEAKASKRRSDEIPFQSVKGFNQIFRRKA